MASYFAAQISAIFGLAALSMPLAAARADEAFLCGPSKVVYVKSEDIEARKHSDPCIAAYFGLNVEAAVAAPASQATPPVTAAAPATPAFKTLAAPEKTERVTEPDERFAALSAPQAAPGTDYRNVRIINAESGGEQWFRHVR